MVNWVKDMIGQIGPPKILTISQMLDNSELPTFRGLKPSQTNSKWPKIWNIGSLMCIINFQKVAGHEKFLDKIYSKANWAIVCCLTLGQNYESWHLLKIGFHQIIQVGKIESCNVWIFQLKGSTLKNHIGLKKIVRYICMKSSEIWH